MLPPLTILLALATALPLAAAAQQPAGTVVAWGCNLDEWGHYGGQVTVPTGLNDVVAIAAGGQHSLALRQDGTVVAWGRVAGVGQNSVPDTVPSGLDQVIAIAGGWDHSLALRQDGTVIAWGANYAGETNVPSGLNGVIAVAAGENHSLALKQDGTVVAWGLIVGQPATVPSGLSGVRAIASGDWHNLALKQDGTVVAWGYNANGQCNVPSGLSGVIAITAGGWHSLALKQDRTVVGWGDNGFGESEAPAGLKGVMAMAAGENHSLALKPDGTVAAWGANTYGQSAVPSGLRGAIAVAAGEYHSLALVVPCLSPRIVTQPSNQTVGVGGHVTFSPFVQGVSPLRYQWLFNGLVVPGATDGSLSLTNMQMADAGNYQVVITNACGSATSAIAALSVVGPPVIGSQPLSQTAELGSTTGFRVVITNVPPVAAYQWYFNGTNRLFGATNSLLVLTNLQPEQAGGYIVVITDFGGAVTSHTATLSVIVPVARRTVPALHLTGDAGSLLHLTHAETLGLGAPWPELDAVALTNSPQLYLDLSDPLSSYRFYRAWQTNVPSVRPAVDVSMATEITLTGAIGSKLRIDYINQYGPTDAWVTLDTVTLTNTMQHYYDLTMFRQPTRLYRLLPVP